MDGTPFLGSCSKGEHEHGLEDTDETMAYGHGLRQTRGGHRGEIGEPAVQLSAANIL